MKRKYLLQSKGDKLDNEVTEAKKLLDSIRGAYIISETSVRPDVPDIEDYIPIGTIEFVEHHLKEYYDISQTCPIEIPKFLRTPEILKRYYNIVKVKDLPKDGAYFLKSAQHLKTLQFSGLTQHARTLMDAEDWCVISETLASVYITGEFRVFVHNGKIQAIKRYEGYAKEPSEQYLQVVVNLMNEYFPINTYSFDVGIYDESSPTEFLIEVHAVSSLGTYGFVDLQILDMYAVTYDFFKSTTHKNMLENRNLIW